jgi:hypothetical protein
MNANDTCGCCDGIQQLTPLSIANRPGLDALLYRIGTYASFVETMLARLSNLPLRLGDLNAPLPDGSDPDALIYPLQGLTTRDQSDPAIAMLHAWATVADVLTFYQERIANEGYLRTATERRSLLELARLVGYVLRPGVAASVFLAYTLEKDHNSTIDLGNRAQSVPRPGQLPQSFETAEKLEARSAWNALNPRLTRPQYVYSTDPNASDVIYNSINTDTIYLQGTATKLVPGDALLLLFGDSTQITNYAFLKVFQAQAQTADKRTRVQLASTPATSVLSGDQQASAMAARARSIAGKQASSPFRDLITALTIPPSTQPRTSQRLERTISQAFSARSDIHPQVLVNINPFLRLTLYNALGNTQTTQAEQAALPPPLQEVQALRVKASLFGHNLPLSPPPPPSSSSPPSQGPGLRESTLLISGSQPAEGQSPQGNAAEQQAEVPVEPSAGQPVEPPAEPPLAEPPGSTPTSAPPGGASASASDDAPYWIALDAEYKEITVGSYVVVERRDDPSNPDFLATTVDDVEVITLGDKPADNNLRLFTTYGSSSITNSQSSSTTTTSDPIKIKVTVLKLHDAWLKDGEADDQSKKKPLLTSTTVYAQSEELQRAEEPIKEDIASDIALKEGVFQAIKDGKGVGTDTIELDSIYDGLKSGQRLIVSGERTDVFQDDGTPIPGIQISELVMLSTAKQDVAQITITLPDPTTTNPKHKRTVTGPLPGDKKHTFLKLASPLAYAYKRDTVIIYGNVVRATHGETRNEVLGSGDATQELQSFTLRQSPLTYVAATTTSGVASSLQVRVNDILWHEVPSLPGLTPTDRDYITETDDADKTTVIFGNGQYGSRLPTGVENVKAVYRTGIGESGNVQAGQISQVVTKPLGVKGVTNPLAATGGADRESIISARRNIPLATLALDRLVSVQDYADFARTFAGIGKAGADSLSNGRRRLVYLTVAGANNIPIDQNSDLYQNLVQALHKFGDPHQPLQVGVAEVLFLVISVHVRLLPDYELEAVEPQIRAVLLDTFSFERRELGQPVFESEVLSIIQAVAGVDYVDLETLGAAEQSKVITALDLFQQPSSSPEKADAEAEFLKNLGLTGHADVIVKSARQNPNPPPPQFLPAQLVFLTPDVPDTLIITELPQ